MRDGVSGKSRLAAALDPGARRRLVVALARHVVDVLVADERLVGVVVVTADVPFVDAVLSGAAPGLTGSSSSDRQSGLPVRSRTADVIREPDGRPGLNGALDHARERARRLGADRMLVVHADLPLLTGDDVGAVLTADADVVVATDRHATGTNLLSVPLGGHDDGDGFSFRFGPGSRAAHEAEAAARGLTSAVVHRTGSAADLDTIDDWAGLPAALRARLL
nr:2-phospho-L-lactate guanylyltransferase [Isoptericola halotolerans]